MLIRNLLRLAPRRLHNLLFRIIIDKTMNSNPHVCKRLGEVRGKVFLLEVSDINREYVFYVDDERILVDRNGTKTPDVVMKGDFNTFLSLFLHKADADSLFFSRRLMIKGDVKTSVFFKNLLEHL